MDLYDNLNRDEAKRELARWRKRYDRLGERMKLAAENQCIARRHMTALFKRVRVAPAAPKFHY